MGVIITYHLYHHENINQLLDMKMYTLLKNIYGFNKLLKKYMFMMLLKFVESSLSFSGDTEIGC